MGDGIPFNARHLIFNLSKNHLLVCENFRDKELTGKNDQGEHYKWISPGPIWATIFDAHPISSI